MKKIISKRLVLYGLFTVAGIGIGRLIFHPFHKSEEKQQISVQNPKATLWTCAMHPQIRMNEPGKCPICGMDLIPLGQDNTANIDPDAVHLTREAVQLANVLTSVVTRQKAKKEVRLYGKVQADERLLQSQVAHIPGRIEKLTVNFTGERVQRGQTLALIYSPELVTAQQELLETAMTRETQPEIYLAAKERLRQWKLTDSQIAGIETSGSVQDNFEVLANTTGIVMAKRVNYGDYVSQGTVLYDVADLTHVWVMFDAYESDLPFLKEGDWMTFTVQALPGSSFSGNIEFIDPVIDPETRVAKVRVEISNDSGRLKPEMFATGIVKANLSAYRDKLVVPRSAVLWTGKRSIVYVKQTDMDEPAFRIREVELGPMLGNSYVVLNGLNEGDEIVTRGTFSVDAAAQLEGKPSMMNPQGGKTSTGHQHGGMQMTSGHEGATDHSAHQANQSGEHAGHNMAEMPSKIDLNMDFAVQLNDVFDQYIVLKNALVQSDVSKARQTAQKVRQALARADMKLLTGDAHMKWMEISDDLNRQISTIASSGKIEEQRTAFSAFSDQFYEAVKTFGLQGRTVYYQFCPMANDNNGAHWLSDIPEIRNPYFGDAMLSCGDNRDTLRY